MEMLFYETREKTSALNPLHNSTVISEYYNR